MNTKRRAVAFLLGALMLAGVAHGSSTPTKQKPELKRVVMYMRALSTGGISVDFTSGKMECFVRGTHDSKAEREATAKRKSGSYPVFHIVADVSAKELAGLNSLGEQSSLHGFTAKKSDVRERRPGLDECPPTLVLVWSDKAERFSLPLSGTVRSDLAIERKRAYDGMDKVCHYLLKLASTYNKKPYVTVVAVKGPEYKTFMAERDKR